MKGWMEVAKSQAESVILLRGAVDDFGKMLFKNTGGSSYSDYETQHRRSEEAEAGHLIDELGISEDEAKKRMRERRIYHGG
jgi:hypothetical protein